MKLLIFTLFLLFSVSHGNCFALSIGTLEEPPGNFIDKGVIKGLSVDFVKEIQRRIGDNTTIQVFPGARLKSYALKSKNFVAFSMARTKDREDKYHWIALVMRKPLFIYSKRKKHINIKSLNDTKKVKSIGVLRGSIHHDILLKNGFNNIHGVTDHDQNLKKIMSDRIELMCHSAQGMIILCKGMNINYKWFRPVVTLNISLSSIAMSKQSDITIVKRWQKAAKEIKRDGTFKIIAEKWVIYLRKIYGMEATIKDGALNFWK